MPLISVLVVAYNPGDELGHCLDSLMAMYETFRLEIIVVDNHSDNDFIASFTAKYPEIQFIQSDTNLGFGGGNNLAFEHSTGDYILCVNPYLLMNGDALSELLSSIENDPTTGVVGPRTIDSKGQLIFTARRDTSVLQIAIRYLGIILLLPQIAHEGYRQETLTATQPFEVEWLQGSCLLMRRETYAGLHGFDPDYFLYYEDTDICYRIRQSGLTVRYVPAATVQHGEGTTTARYPETRVRSYHLSPIQYYRKRELNREVMMLKIIFVIELTAKIIMRRILNLLKPDDRRKKQLQAEISVLRELGSY